MKQRIIKQRRIAVFLQIALLLLMCFPAVAKAEGTTAINTSLSKTMASVGDNIVVSGTTTPGAWVPLKVIDTAGNIAVFDATKADQNGSYTISFKVPDSVPGTLKVVVGEGSNVTSKDLAIRTGDNPGTGGGGGSPGTGTGGGGGGGGSIDKPAISTTGSATVKPSTGGTISLGEDVKIAIPANALKGTSNQEITITRVSNPPQAAAGFRFLGNVYEFKIEGMSGYNFAEKVTLTFTFDPSSLKPGETPAIYYYDESKQEWVYLGGTVSGNTISVEVDHFTKFAVMAEIETVPVIADKGILNDIYGHWAENNINELVNLGVVSGYPDGTFRPDNNITRAEFAAILIKAFQLQAHSGTVFADTSGHWAQDSIAAAAYYGIVSGYDANTFGPDDPITREQMAVMIVKAAQLSPLAFQLTFTDNNSISEWAKEAMSTAVAKGIIKGYPDNTVRPQGNATRAEAVTVIIKTMKIN